MAKTKVPNSLLKQQNKSPNNEFLKKYIKYQKNLNKYTDKKEKYEKKVKRNSNKRNTEKELKYDYKIDENTTKIRNLVSKKIFGDKEKLGQLNEKLNKLGNFQVIPSHAYSNSYNAFFINFNSVAYTQHNKPYTKQEIKDLCNKVSRILGNMGLKGKIETILDYGGMIRSGQNSDIGNNIKLFDPEILYPNDENEELKEYIDKANNFKWCDMFVRVQNPKYKLSKLGGYSNNTNDCLYNCINATIPQYNPFKNPEDLKHFLGIGRNEMINIDDIEKIEKKIGNVGINVTGDCIYTSKITQKLNIHLLLKNNHYQINHHINRKVTYESYHDRQLLIYDKLQRIGYDGEKFIEIDEKMYDDILNYRTEYIIIPRKNFKKSIEEYYNENKQMADTLLEMSNGKINMYRTGTIKRTALKVLDQTTKHIKLEKILFDEALIIQNATSNGFIFNEDYEGEAYKYDINSLYPFIYSSNTMLVPIERGNFTTLTNDNIKQMNDKLKGGYAYGLYKYNIYRSGNKQIDRLFRFKGLVDKDDDEVSNFYTHIDLKMADMLGLKKELILCDNNALLYPRNKCLTGQQVFGEFKNMLYPLKEKKVEGSKLLLNILSGSLGQINKSKIYIDKDSDEIYDLDDLGLEVLNVGETTNRKAFIYNCVDKEHYFNNQLARFKPFMLSQARKIMFDLILPINDKVKKVYIDSIITTEPMEHFNEMGKLKFEYYCDNIKIQNNKKEIFIGEKIENINLIKK